MWKMSYFVYFGVGLGRFAVFSGEDWNRDRKTFSGCEFLGDFSGRLGADLVDLGAPRFPVRHAQGDFGGPMVERTHHNHFQVLFRLKC